MGGGGIEGIGSIDPTTTGVDPTATSAPTATATSNRPPSSRTRARRRVRTGTPIRDDRAEETTRVRWRAWRKTMTSTRTRRSAAIPSTSSARNVFTAAVISGLSLIWSAVRITNVWMFAARIAAIARSVGPRIHSSVLEFDEGIAYGPTCSAGSAESRPTTTIGRFDEDPGKVFACPTTSTGEETEPTVIDDGLVPTPFAIRIGNGFDRPPPSW